MCNFLEFSLRRNLSFDSRLHDIAGVRKKMISEDKKQLKREVLEAFRRHGYIEGKNDYEIAFKTTSGNISSIQINRIQVIK